MGPCPGLKEGWVWGHVGGLQTCSGFVGLEVLAFLGWGMFEGERVLKAE